MPNRWAVASGNWSNTATWNNGGVLGLPTASDDVFTNNQAVYIDQNVTAVTFRNAASASAIVASGSFYLNDGVTVNLTAANAFLASVAPLIIISGSNSARINGNNTGTGVIATIIQMTGSSTLTMSGSFVGGVASPSTSIQHASSGSLILTGSFSPNGASISAHLVGMTGAGSLYLTGSLSGAQGSSFGINKTAGSGSIYIIGNVSAGGNGTGIVKTSTGDIVVTGNLIATAGADSITNSGAGTILVNGNVFGGGSFFNGIRNSAANILMVITGSVIGAGNTAYGINNVGLNSTIIVSGSVLGGTSTAAGMILSTNASTLIITGSVIGSPTAGAIINSVASTILITGSVASSIGGSGITTSGAGILRIEGPISSSISFPGIQSTSTGQVFLTGPFYNANNRNAVYAQNLQLISGSTPTWTFDTETYGGTKTLYTSGSVTGYPATTNVRQGIIFGDTGQFTGTVAIPSASNVIRGALVDNTTGSASFTTQNVWNFPTSSLTVTGSIGERLRNASTVTIDANLITSKGKL
jgi:hypothetical protein